MSAPSTVEQWRALVAVGTITRAQLRAGAGSTVTTAAVARELERVSQVAGVVMHGLGLHGLVVRVPGERSGYRLTRAGLEQLRSELGRRLMSLAAEPLTLEQPPAADELARRIVGEATPYFDGT